MATQPVAMPITTAFMLVETKDHCHQEVLLWLVKIFTTQICLFGMGHPFPGSTMIAHQPAIAFDDIFIIAFVITSMVS